MYLEQLGFRHLLTLGSLHRTKSMRKTAEALGRSQPAISLQIKSLEAIVGFDLLEHDRGRLKFTRRGVWLAHRSAQIISDMESLICDAAAVAEARVRVGLTEDLCRRNMKDLSVFLKDPWIDVNVQCSAELVSRFNREELDIIIAKGDAPIEGAKCTWRHQLAWASHKPHWKKNNIGISLVLLQNGCLYHKLARQTLDSAFLPYSVQSICSSWQEIFHTLERGGVTVVSRDWPGEAPLCYLTDELPPLPNTTINLLLNQTGSDSHREECERLAKRIVERLNLPERHRLI